MFCPEAVVQITGEVPVHRDIRLFSTMHCLNVLYFQQCARHFQNEQLRKSAFLKLILSARNRLKCVK